MTTATLTLTDFLLARIGEDEAVVKSIDLDPANVFRQAGGSRLRWLVLAGDRPWLDGRARLLAECEFKRGLVADLERSRTYDDEGLAFGICVGMARLWADHPDYQQEWGV